MIAKISSGKSTAGLIRYLYGPGRANEHTDPHLVASWDGFAPDPGRTDDTAATKKLLVADLDLRVQQARRLGRAPKQHVWHCSVRAAPGDRTLGDAEWADIARRVVTATGIAPTDDPDGCRWIAVRHADDHIHIAATKIRGDLRTARHWNDYLTADRELSAVEKEYGLFQVVRGDRTAAKRPTRAEQEKAHRTGHDKPARVRLRSLVRTAAAAATTTEEFLALLTRTNGVLVEVLHFPSGEPAAIKSPWNTTRTPKENRCGSPARRCHRTSPSPRSRAVSPQQTSLPAIPTGIYGRTRGTKPPQPRSASLTTSAGRTPKPPRPTWPPSAKHSTPWPSPHHRTSVVNFGRQPLPSNGQPVHVSIPNTTTPVPCAGQ